MSTRHGVVFARVSLLQHTQARMHVVYVVPDGDEPRPFEPWIRYIQETDGMRRLKWQREAAGAVCLLLDYAHAHGAVGAAIDADTLRGFAEALLCGAQHLDEAGRSGLSWAPRSRARAARCLSLVTAFLDWIAERFGRQNANPWRDANAVERLAQIRRLDNRAARSLLSHAAYRHRDAVTAGRIREVRIAQAPTSAPHAELRAFSENDFERFLEEGLARPAPPLASWSRRHRLRNVLVSILLHGGGLRLSEPFHLYLEDVRADPLCPTSALVRLFHPELGQAPIEGERRWRDREHYLRERWNRLPRTLERGRFHAGWKNLALSDGQARCAFVHWAPLRWGEIFLDLFRLYIAHRPRADHPFAFVSEHPHHRGAPYTVESFTQAHARAVRRIGLVTGKSHGTSPHAHRHAYGRRLRAAGVQPLFIQRAMHHRSADSQLVYTAPSMAELAGALRAADARMKSPSGLAVGEGVAHVRI